MRAFAELLLSRGPCALFESTTPRGPLARQSLLARTPLAVLTQDGDGSRVATSGGEAAASGDVREALRDLLGRVPRGHWPEEGAVVGVLAYDAARPHRPPASTPRLLALAVERLLVDEEGTPARGAVPKAPRLPASDSAPLDLAALSSLTPAEHRALVLRLKEHIARGDIYQANLSQRFTVPFPHPGLDLYRALRQLSPAPFSGYFRAGDLEIVSASPERLLEVRDGVISTRPIAGTRPRSADPELDLALGRELLLSEKERAEHLMLVDLARNDIGQVAEIGSVQVDELMVVEEYAQVRHIVSNVRARLAPGRDALDALFALFPGGTITGVPKRRCMEILDEVEPVPRGFYTGALFYVTPSGRLDANILIRSAVVTRGFATFHTGGGIVADSDPAFEYQETLHKARGMKLALEEVLSAAVPPRS